jgi:heme exporter protein A
MTSLAAQPNLATTPPAIPAVRAAGVSFWIDERPILREVGFDIDPGSFVALLGANGAGKSTLLRLLATLAHPTHGELFLFGQPLRRNSTKVRGRIGMIGHQAMLYRDLAARENLEFFGRLYGVKDPAGRARELLALVGLSDRANDPVKAFSRGMTQRVAIARALMHEPDLLLADEPFAGLDAPSITALEGLLTQLHQGGKTIVLVNHDIQQSLWLAKRAIVLRRGKVVLDRPTVDLSAEAVMKEMTAR